MEDIDEVRRLMVFTGRPEFTPPGGIKHFYRQITLNRLSKRESLQIFQQLLGAPDIEKKLSDLMLGKTGGKNSPSKEERPEPTSERVRGGPPPHLRARPSWIGEFFL